MATEKRRRRLPNRSVGEDEIKKCIKDLSEKIDDFSGIIKEFTRLMAEMIKETKRNTHYSINLATEIKKQREVDEKNTAFLQSLVKDFLKTQNAETKSMWELVKTVTSWVLRIGAIIIIAAMGIKTLSPYIPFI